MFLCLCSTDSAGRENSVLNKTIHSFRKVRSIRQSRFLGVRSAGSARSVLAVLLVLLPAMVHVALARDDYRALRQQMVKEIEADVEETRIRIGKESLDLRVMNAMATVPRHEFVPFAQKDYAYQNRPLPIGYGQTISQPYIVALMTDLLEVEPDAVVLEIGTGSGYQSAILSGLVKRVYTIEIITELEKEAGARLQRLGYKNVKTYLGDGYYGWPEHAPFDGIMVTAAVSQIPPPLVRQLKPGGRMVIPVGSPFLTQQLTLVEKDLEGEVRTRQVLPVKFVPLTGKR